MGEKVADGANVVGACVGWIVGEEEGASVGDIVGSFVSPR